ncbi:HD domain-containing protein, partial [bacterium]|nr:HD domain-containing protein [candidate division CSSED10-310 bacterium]
MKNIRDAIHGDQPFTDLECRLMDTASMQRLRGIKQLGSSSLVYPSAVHTRFEHSLGTCYMSKQIMESIERNSDFKIPSRDRQIISIAALLHDVTHIPFGHTLEDERRIFPRHDEDELRLNNFFDKGVIREILSGKQLLEPVRGLLGKNNPMTTDKPYMTQIISHAICADLLDYLRRDARFCGLNLDFDNRIFRYFMIENDRLVLNLQKNGLFRHDAFSEVIHLLRIRYFLTERVYYHHAKIAAGAMLSRAV